MNKKTISKITSTNLVILISIMFYTSKFMSELKLPMYALKAGAKLNSLKYSIVKMNFNITETDHSNFDYEILYFPLILIFIGIIYNVYIKIKIYRSEKNKKRKSNCS
ncbi:hypothetical protein ACFIJ5_18585 (plasmid) [Haloimpatiens sp. FM7330]|uniref:hypothetical protein n=1 Tax=Haloimpatiens sp. FM7330 TaxID=3298610 RepID=UPI0036252B64